MSGRIILLDGVRGGGKSALAAAVRAAAEQEARTLVPLPSDVRALVTLDAEFAETGETSVPAERVQQLVDLGWLEKGEEPDEIAISEQGRLLLAGLDAEVEGRGLDREDEPDAEGQP